MGYTTTFEGSFTITPSLTLKDYHKYYRTYIDDGASDGLGSYCQWVINKDGDELEWDQKEKFYEYIPWLEFLITNFFTPKGYVLNGKVEWKGEERWDVGTITIKDNVVTVQKGAVPVQKGAVPVESLRYVLASIMDDVYQWGQLNGRGIMLTQAHYDEAFDRLTKVIK